MLRTVLRRSRILTAAFACAHLIAGFALVPLDVPLAAKLLTSVAIVASLIHAVRRYAWLRSRTAIVALELKDRETANVQFKVGTWHEARVLGTSYVSPLLTVVNVRVKGGRFAKHVLIVRDNVDPDDFRQLRVILRWSHVRATDATTF